MHIHAQSTGEFAQAVPSDAAATSYFKFLSEAWARGGRASAPACFAGGPACCCVPPRRGPRAGTNYTLMLHPREVRRRAAEQHFARAPPSELSVLLSEATDSMFRRSPQRAPRPGSGDVGAERPSEIGGLFVFGACERRRR